MKPAVSPAALERRALLRSGLQVLGLAAAAAWLPACGRKQTKGQAVPTGATVLALGDSLTSGVGADRDSAYPAVLARLTGWAVVNGGVSGDTSAQALGRLPALLAEHRPALVIVSIGGNDFLRRLPESDTRAHIRSIVQQSLQSGAQVLLVAVPALSMAAALGHLSDHALYADLASELKVPLMPDAWSDVLSRNELKSDRIHANARGYEHFAQRLQERARAVGLLTG